MTPFWSAWIMFLIVLNLGITLFLFLWGPRVKIPVLPDGTTGHVWAHGVLREGLHKLPLWWLLFSGAMFVIGFAYLYLYPGFGSFKGALGWTSHQQLADDTAANSAKLEPLLKGLADQPVEVIARKAFVEADGGQPRVDVHVEAIDLGEWPWCASVVTSEVPKTSAPLLIDELHEHHLAEVE